MDPIQFLTNQFMDNMAALSNGQEPVKPEGVDATTWKVMGSMIAMGLNCMQVYVGVALDVDAKQDSKPPIGPEAMTTTGEATDIGLN